MAKPTIARTDWAELQVEDLLSVPLVSEFVFHSPKHHDPDEKEVVDHLVVHRQQSIIISQKAQDDRRSAAFRVTNCGYRRTFRMP
jgi:hypothetical protein